MPEGIQTPPAVPPAGSIDADTIKKIVGEYISPLQERIEGQSKYIAKLEGQIKETKPPKEEPKPGETKLVEEVAALKAEAKKNADRTAKLREQSAVAQVRDVFVQNGVPVDAAQWAARSFYRDNAGSIEMEENDNMEVTPVVVQGDKRSSLNDYASAWLGTKEGSALVAPKNNPQLPTGGTRGAPKVKYTRAQINAGQFDISLLNSGGAEVIG